MTHVLCMIGKARCRAILCNHKPQRRLPRCIWCFPRPAKHAFQHHTPSLCKPQGTVPTTLLYLTSSVVSITSSSSNPSCIYQDVLFRKCPAPLDRRILHYPIHISSVAPHTSRRFLHLSSNLTSPCVILMQPCLLPSPSTAHATSTTLVIIYQASLLMNCIFCQPFTSSKFNCSLSKFKYLLSIFKYLSHKFTSCKDQVFVTQFRDFRTLRHSCYERQS
jgi:hypothetical protein